MYFLPKTQVLDDPYFKDIDIEVSWDKYIEMDDSNRCPYDHQKEAIKFLLSRGSSILGLDMGLGKTISSIIASIEGDYKKILVVCPSSMKIGWKREIESYGKSSTMISGSFFPDAVGQYTIINFDILKNFHTCKGENLDIEGNKMFEPYIDLLKQRYDLIIVDEAHNLKNPKAKRVKIINELVLKYGIKDCWLLTGTPIANRPMDYFNLLKLVKSPVADNWNFFAKRYCDAKTFYKKTGNKSKKITVANGASNLDELNIKTRNKLLMRKKNEVMDMPDKTVTLNYNELTPRGRVRYEQIFEEYLDQRRKDGKRAISCLMEDVVETLVLRQFMAMENVPNTIELVDSAIEQGNKVIIFTSFHDEMEALSDYYGNKCVLHNGRMNIRDKQNSVDRFQTDSKVKVFIGNIKSAGVGITLTASNVVVFNSFDWVPGNNEQAEDRSFRIGQKNNVTVYYQLHYDTVSLLMWFTVMKKQKNINKIISTNPDGEENKRFNRLLEDLENNGLYLDD
jgi:SWI/SNF-related matrix-associated actin-dependent regulator 1 of chromatin subfamily A